MTDQEQVAQEATPDVVQTEAEQVTAPEAAESTTGQDDNQPAEVTESEPKAEEISPSKQRRDRRNAAVSKLRDELQTVQKEKARVEQHLAEIKQLQQQQPPRFEDFNDHDDFVAAKAAYASMTLLDDRQAKSLEKEAERYSAKEENLQQVRMREAQQNWAAQSEEAKSRYSDFDAVAGAPDVAITTDMAGMLAMSDVGADMAYHLGMNKDQARQIAGMSPDAQSGAMAMLEQFISTSTLRPKTKTTAPEPISPVKASASGVSDPAKMSPDQYREWRQKGGSF